MQFLPLYVTKNYIDPFPKLVINKSSYLPAPDEVCQSRLACYQTFDGCFALEDKIKKSRCYVWTASYFVDTFLTGKMKKSYINITETKDNTCRSLPLDLRSGTYNV